LGRKKALKNDWKCPYCGTIFEKLGAFKLMEKRFQDGADVSVGGPTNCPYCHHELSFSDLMTGKYDV
jgi:hypothetical protein